MGMGANIIIFDIKSLYIYSHDLRFGQFLLQSKYLPNNRNHLHITLLIVGFQIVCTMDLSSLNFFCFDFVEVSMQNCSNPSNKC
jgi:hypothetical protein